MNKVYNFKNLAIIFFLLFAVCVVPGRSELLAATGNGAQLSTIDSPSPKAPDDTEALHKRNWRYTLHPSDVLELTFMMTPEYNQTLTVQPDGYVTLRDVGDLQIVGKTLSETIEAIKTAYSKLLHEPMISIDLKDFEKPYFVVGGEVGKPGKFDWRGDITLTQAIAIAGGFTEAAKHSQVLLFRRVSDQWTSAKIINVKKMFESRDLLEDPDLKPGDMLFVPKNALSKIKPFLPTSSIGMYGNPAIP